MITLRLAEPHETPVHCLARRGPRSRIECEMPALHAYGDPFPLSRMHAGRSRVGAWFFWPTRDGGTPNA